MADWSLVGLILSSTVVVELIRMITAGMTKRRRAKGKESTDLDLALDSRSAWKVHARRLRHHWWTLPRPDLPEEPTDPWPPTHLDQT